MNADFRYVLRKLKLRRFNYNNTYIQRYVGRFQAAVTSFRGKIWVVGGCDAWNPLRSVEIYDPANNSWSQGPPIATPRRGCGLAVRKGKKEKISKFVSKKVSI